MKRERSCVKLAILSLRMLHKFKPPKKGKTDKKVAPFAAEVKTAADEMTKAWAGAESRLEEALSGLAVSLSAVMTSVALSQGDDTTATAVASAASSINVAGGVLKSIPER